MKLTTERLENCQVNIIVEMDAADIEKELRQTARKLSRHYNVPGYRRGKAPYHAVIRVFGREAVQQQALEDFGQDLYDKALEEIEYEPYEPGELKEVEWDPFRMTILLPIKPELDLGDYRSVRVPFDPEPVTDEDIEERLKHLQEENAQWVPVERPAALGDQVVLDMEGKVGEHLIMSNEDHEMILEAGSKIPLPGLHEEIVGMSPGEEKTFVLTVPEDDFEEDVAGQEATVTVQLHTVREHDLPLLDDELAMMVGDYASLDDLKTALRESMESDALQQAESQYLDKVLEAMLETAVKIEYPPQAIEREADLALGQIERNLAASGLQLDTYLGMVGKTREGYKQELRPTSEERLRKRLVLDEIARLEELEADPEALEAELDRLRHMMEPDDEQVQEMLASPEIRQSVARDLTMAKVQELVIQIGKGEIGAEDEAKLEAQPEAATEAEGEAELETDVEVEVAPSGEAQAEIEAEASAEMAKGETGDEPEAEGAE